MFLIYAWIQNIFVMMYLACVLRIGEHLLFIVQLITGKQNKEVTMTWVSIMDYLFNKWSWICSFCLGNNPILSSLDVKQMTLIEQKQLTHPTNLSSLPFIVFVEFVFSHFVVFCPVLSVNFRPYVVLFCPFFFCLWYYLSFFDWLSNRHIQGRDLFYGIYVWSRL